MGLIGGPIGFFAFDSLGLGLLHSRDEPFQSYKPICEAEGRLCQEILTTRHLLWRTIAMVAAAYS